MAPGRSLSLVTSRTALVGMVVGVALGLSLKPALLFVFPALPMRLTTLGPRARSMTAMGATIAEAPSAQRVGLEQEEQEELRGKEEELAELEKLVVQGDMNAHFRLGQALRKGRWIEQDFDRAFELILEAAEQDHVRAQFMTGLMLIRGEGCEVDVETGMNFLTMAAEEGLAKAQNAIGMLHLMGEGPDGEDLLSAAFWLKKAAEQGNAEAQYQLGTMLLEGHGLESNATWAASFFEKAALQGQAEAQEAFAQLLWKGVGVPQSKAQAARWFSEAAEQENAEASFCLGCMLRTGE
ncbi:unnamed protein product, partial [Polarella glacialis]